MHCEAKVGRFTGDVGELAKRYLAEFERLLVGRGDVTKYMSFHDAPEGRTLVTVSFSSYPNEPYNSIITVVGKDERAAKRIMDSLTSRMHIDYKDAPQSLMAFYQHAARSLSF